MYVYIHTFGAHASNPLISVFCGSIIRISIPVIATAVNGNKTFQFLVEAKKKRGKGLGIASFQVGQKISSVSGAVQQWQQARLRVTWKLVKVLPAHFSKV